MNGHVAPLIIMGLREELVRRIERKQQEIKELELKVREASAYIQGLQDTLKLVPKESNGRDATVLRPGTDIARAQDAIIAAGRPLHINEILSALGKPVESKARLALAGSLARYVRQGSVFERTAPNTFGVIQKSAARAISGPEPPDDFGMDEPQGGD